MVKKDINVKVQYVECGRNKCKRQAICRKLQQRHGGYSCLAEDCSLDKKYVAYFVDCSYYSKKLFFAPALHYTEILCFTSVEFRILLKQVT